MSAGLKDPVFTRDYLLPAWQSQSGNIWLASFHTAAMLTRIGTYDLNFNGAYLRVPADFEPRIARIRQRINRVSNHRPPDAKVVFCDSVGDPIA